ncbi:uncharacterized protein ARMOST_17813 [Armillaria ostoyae]|uniref:Uncharacterized protein n=1 Tax=Armillaria ostoyae TaxID=47428 RepID=A0A284S051_ARMOS|nr:uncharacterized protein ARMOST_17813 [Armillaria ostoyae]
MLLSFKLLKSLPWSPYSHMPTAGHSLGLARETAAMHDGSGFGAVMIALWYQGLRQLLGTLFGRLSMQRETSRYKRQGHSGGQTWIIEAAELLIRLYACHTFNHPMREIGLANYNILPGSIGEGDVFASSPAFAGLFWIVPPKRLNRLWLAYGHFFRNLVTFCLIGSFVLPTMPAPWAFERWTLRKRMERRCGARVTKDAVSRRTPGEMPLMAVAVTLQLGCPLGRPSIRLQTSYIPGLLWFWLLLRSYRRGLDAQPNVDSGDRLDLLYFTGIARPRIDADTATITIMSEAATTVAKGCALYWTAMTCKKTGSVQQTEGGQASMPQLRAPLAVWDMITYVFLDVWWFGHKSSPFYGRVFVAESRGAPYWVGECP